MKRLPRFLFLALSVSPAFAAQPAIEDHEVVAVSSHASDDYVRTKRPDGSWPIETYAFGEGGLYFSSQRDDSLEGVKFMNVARTIAGPLAEQGYVPSHDPAKTRFLIMVYWGMTSGAGGASTSMAYQAMQGTQPINVIKQGPPPPPPGVSNMAAGLNRLGGGLDSVQTGQLSAQVQALTLIRLENEARDRENERKARLLGFNHELAGTIGFEATPLRHRREQLIDELEDNRYFVVLLAYDFQVLWKEKKRKLVWEARYSIRERGNRFDQQLEAMTRSAARHFGQNSEGLKRQSFPRGTVEMGELEIIGTEPGK
ncbi:hypothetical protein ESB00_02795 [Oleiharenicola lentus]|uniref:Uncharacterized protein n=1 Tax=Oleiharenicola lentus TaxID=2508720 RepID=A0A4Q1C7T2_9BACT|nr:hypothetical protein [Oleiharenicola lentus]RXK54842.1 hypothetical protein ESB00_02795 [Oleiharenicola lentus]